MHETAGAVIYKKINNHYYILLIYKRWDELEGWFMPKGHIENGESPETAAQRECVEETGYQDITTGELIKTVKIQYPWSDGKLHKKTIHWYLGKLNSDKKIPKKLGGDEKSSLVKQEWFEINEAIMKVRFDDDKKVIRLALSLLTKLY